METKKFQKDDEYIVESDFEYDGEEFKVGHIFRVLNDINTATGVAYITTEWKHKLIHGHDGSGLGKETYCWDVDTDIINKHCKRTDLVEDIKPKEKLVVSKRLTKKEFKTVLKSLHEA